MKLHCEALPADFGQCTSNVWFAIWRDRVDGKYTVTVAYEPCVLMLHKPTRVVFATMSGNSVYTLQ